MKGTLSDLSAMPGMPSEPTLRKLIADRPDFPILSRGSNGVAYEFDLEEAFAFVRSIKDEERAAAAARHEEVRQLGLQLLGEDAASAALAGAPASAKDRRELLEEELAAIRVGEKRRDLVRKAPVIAAVGAFVGMVADKQTTLAERLAKRAHVSRDVIATLNKLIDQDRRDIAAGMERMADAVSGDQGDDTVV